MHLEHFPKESTAFTAPKIMAPVSSVSIKFNWIEWTERNGEDEGISKDRAILFKRAAKVAIYL